MVVMIGEALVDLIDGKAYPGGCPFNAALAARRLGVNVTLLDNISSDEYGALIASRLQADDIAVPENFLHDERPTMYSQVVLDEKGQAKYLFKTEGTATLGLDAQKLEDALENLGKIDVILIGSVAIMLEPSGPAIKEAVAHYKEHHPETTIFLDPNVRPTLITDKKAYRTWMARIIPMANMIKLSDEDLAFLMDKKSYEENIEAFRKLRKGEFVVTRGAMGSEWHRADGTVFSAPAGDIKIVDTVGAGDTFNGALVRCISVKGIDPSEFSDDECRQTLSLAAHTADINCTRRGCDPPTAKELGL